MAFPSPFTSATPALDILKLLGYDESFYDEPDEHPLTYGGRKQNVYLCDHEEPEVSFIPPSLKSINTGNNFKIFNPPIVPSSDSLWSAGFVEKQPVSSDKIKNSNATNNKPNTIPFIEFSAFNTSIDNKNTLQDFPESDKIGHNICTDLSSDKTEESSKIPPGKTTFPQKGESYPVVVIPQYLGRKQPLTNSDNEDTRMYFFFVNPYSVSNFGLTNFCLFSLNIQTSIKGS
jgi:hypothetical protein